MVKVGNNPTQAAELSARAQEAARKAAQSSSPEQAKKGLETSLNDYLQKNPSGTVSQWQQQVQSGIGGPEGAPSFGAAGGIAAGVQALVGEAYMGNPMAEPPIPEAGAGSDAHWNETPTRVDLYPTGSPKSEDVWQHSLSDCYVDSTLASMAQQNPQQIQNAITQTGTGDPPTYSVKMFDPQGKPIEVAVNGRTLYDPSGKSVNNSDGAGAPTWATIMEKAYAKYNSVYDVTDGITSAPDGYGGIADGGAPRSVVAAFTGHTTDLVPAGQSMDAMSQGLSNKQAVMVNTMGDTTTSDGQKIIGGHVYQVVSVDPQTQTVVVRNPWGGSDPNGHGGLVTMSYADFGQVFRTVSLETGTTGPAAS